MKSFKKKWGTSNLRKYYEKKYRKTKKFMKKSMTSLENIKNLKEY